MASITPRVARPHLGMLLFLAYNYKYLEMLLSCSDEFRRNMGPHLIFGCGGPRGLPILEFEAIC